MLAKSASIASIPREDSGNPFSPACYGLWSVSIVSATRGYGASSRPEEWTDVPPDFAGSIGSRAAEIIDPGVDYVLDGASLGRITEFLRKCVRPVGRESARQKATGSRRIHQAEN